MGNPVDAYFSGTKVKWLLDNGVDVNVRSEAGFTPLIFAISSKAPPTDVTKTVEALLEAGADCNSARGPYQMTPTMCAVTGGNPEILKLILAKKPDVNITNTEGQTALQIARASNHSQEVVMLKEAGAKE